MRANLLVVGVAASLAGCASGAWSRVGDESFTVPWPPPVTAHRAVEHVTLRVAGREFEFVGYRSTDPQRDEVRAQLLLESGLSVLDVAAHGERDERFSGSAFEAIPHLAEIVTADLRHTWGSRSVWGTARAPVEGADRLLTTLVVSDGQANVPAIELNSGARAAISPAARNGSLHVVILDEDLVPEATVDYSDFEDGVPREIHLADLVHEHTLDIEVEEVHFPKAAEK